MRTNTSSPYRNKMLLPNSSDFAFLELTCLGFDEASERFELMNDNVPHSYPKSQVCYDEARGLYWAYSSVYDDERLVIFTWKWE